jgi:LacI family transcriptional regulator
MAQQRVFCYEQPWIQEGPISEEAGYEAALRLLSTSAPRALICCSDRLAFGVLRAAADLRKRIPRDVAVLTIDGTVQAAYTHPALTAIRIPWFEMFTIAAKLLLDMVEETPSVHQVAVRLRCELVVRESTAGARGRARAPASVA